MAELSKALRSGRSRVFPAWVRIPLLTNVPFEKGTAKNVEDLQGNQAVLTFIYGLLKSSKRTVEKSLIVPVLGI